jgi:hypothetical protein
MAETLETRIVNLEKTVGSLKTILDRILEIDVVTTDGIARAVLAIRVDRPEPASILASDKEAYIGKGIPMIEPEIEEELKKN